MATRHHGVRLAGALVLMVALAVVVFWVIGFLPWVLGGFALPAPEAHGSGEGLTAVRLAVPLVVARLPELVASSLLGGVLAGMVPIAFVRVPRSWGLVVTACAVLATTSAVLVASHRALDRHASAQFGGDGRIVEGLALAVVLAVVPGLAVGLAATVRHGLVAVAAGLVAAALPAWLAALPGWGWASGTAAVVLAAAALLVGLVVSVHRTRLSALLWPLAVALAWLGAPLAAATTDVADRLGPGSRLALGDLVRHAAAAAGGVAGPGSRPWWPWAVAVVAAVGWLFRRPRGASTGSAKTHDDTPTPNHNLSQKVDGITTAPLAFSSHVRHRRGRTKGRVRCRRGDGRSEGQGWSSPW